MASTNGIGLQRQRGCGSIGGEPGGDTRTIAVVTPLALATEAPAKRGELIAKLPAELDGAEVIVVDLRAPGAPPKTDPRKPLRSLQVRDIIRHLGLLGSDSIRLISPRQGTVTDQLCAGGVNRSSSRLEF